MARYTKLEANAFKQMQINAGLVLSEFDPSDGSYEKDTDILGATTGGVNTTIVPTFSDFGDDVDNCPKNTKELKRIDGYEIKCTGNFVTMKKETAKRLAVAADVSGDKIALRDALKDADFADVWVVGDYSDMNGETNGGFLAVHLIDALSTGGFALQTTDKAKGQFAFEFTAHYSTKDVSKVPVEIYIHEGTAE